MRTENGHIITRRQFGNSLILCRHYGAKLVYPDGFLSHKDSTNTCYARTFLYQYGFATPENPGFETNENFVSKYLGVLQNSYLQGFTINKTGYYRINFKAQQMVDSSGPPGATQRYYLVRVDFDHKGNIIDSTYLNATAEKNILRDGGWVDFELFSSNIKLYASNVIMMVCETIDTHLHEQNAYLGICFNGDS